MLPILRYFYIFMNLLYILVRSYFGLIVKSEGIIQEYILEGDIIIFERIYKSRSNPLYYKMASLLAQSFTLRVIVLFYNVIEELSYLLDVIDRDNNNWKNDRRN